MSSSSVLEKKKYDNEDDTDSEDIHNDDDIQTGQRWKKRKYDNESNKFYKLWINDVKTIFIFYQRSTIA